VGVRSRRLFDPWVAVGVLLLIAWFSHLHHCALLGRLELRRSHDVDGYVITALLSASF